MIPNHRIFHIQLTKESKWQVEIGLSLAHVMISLTGNPDYEEPYCWFEHKE
jgi:hypothetical protein